MNSLPQAPVRRRIWPWVLGICLTPFLVLAIVAASFLTLERNAAVLRKHVMAATDASWQTKIQLSIGGIALGAIRTGLAFVHDKDLGDARMALAAVQHASVGVYERRSGPANWSQEQLFADTDQVMQKRGWTRLVGVADSKETVLIYIPQDFDSAKAVDLCLAVLSGKKLVVVSTSVDAAKLAALAENHSSDELKARLHLARLRL